MGSSSNGRTLVWHTKNRGSIPLGSTEFTDEVMQRLCIVRRVKAMVKRSVETQIQCIVLFRSVL